MTVYRPSWGVNMLLQLDDAAVVNVEPAADEFGAVLAPPDQAPSAGGLEPLVLKRGQRSRLLATRPLSASVESPATRQAGKFEFSLAYADLPIDPRLIRSASVEVYLGNVSADDFGAGMAGTFDRGRRVSQVSTIGGLVRGENLLLVGAVDTWTQRNSEKGGDVTLVGRDLRGLFLDAKPPMELLAKLDLRQPIASASATAGSKPARLALGVVNQILALVPFGALCSVAVDPDEWPDGRVPSPGSADGATRVTLGAKGEGAVPGAGAPGQQATSQSTRPSAWDLCTQYAFLVGAIPYFDGWTLRVRPAYNYFDLRQAGLDAEAAARRMLGVGGPPLSTPFKGGLPRDVGEDQLLRVRRMVYGRDLKSLTFERKFQGAAKTPVIEVVGIDDTKRGMQKLITAQWPPKDAVQARQTKVAPGGEVAQTDTLRIPVHGIRDVKQLEVMARGLYEEIGRQELSGVAETPNLASYGGGPDDPDLVRLRTGEAVEFVVDVRTLSSRAPLVSELVEMSGRADFAAQVTAVRKAFPQADEDLARAVVASARGSALNQLRTFKVANVKYTLVRGGATTVAFDFQNYVTLRHQVGAEEQRRGQRPVVSRVPARAQPALVAKPTRAQARSAAKAVVGALAAVGAVSVGPGGPQLSPVLQQGVSAAVDAVNAVRGLRR